MYINLVVNCLEQLGKDLVEPDRMATASLTGSAIDFDYFPLERAISSSGVSSLRTFERTVCFDLSSPVC